MIFHSQIVGLPEASHFNGYLMGEVLTKPWALDEFFFFARQVRGNHPRQRPYFRLAASELLQFFQNTFFFKGGSIQSIYIS